MILASISKDPYKPSAVTRSKLSASVWYSGYSPYFDRKNHKTEDQLMAHHTVAHQILVLGNYKFLTICFPINAEINAKSARVFPVRDSMWLKHLSSPTQLRLKPQTTLFFNVLYFYLDRPMHQSFLEQRQIYRYIEGWGNFVGCIEPAPKQQLDRIVHYLP